MKTSQQRPIVAVLVTAILSLITLSALAQEKNPERNG